MQEEHLTKILFTKAHALCHDINAITKGPTHIDVVLGFSTGDIIWYEPISQKYVRINKNVSEIGPVEGYMLIQSRAPSIRLRYQTSNGFPTARTSSLPLIWTEA